MAKTAISYIMCINNIYAIFAIKSIGRAQKIAKPSALALFFLCESGPVWP
jgi:hypothetical protein